ncbi:hypothetical protein [Streptomyces sp. NL15-2K]|uniref:hypothetical protein n=1 Tax=Streptomyces sp. NL15-2K TaxID=376149 RepID=UPI000FF974BE|nr:MULTISPECIES: hypothetical protein [Actinomycetes]WKX14318.1 hypothetical protein Q4V64_45140 [Kutzneria buriramensis]GCB44621.1 hypothetical protein SNL152K_1911 [Streptomyces sp. NL15-2K]
MAALVDRRAATLAAQMGSGSVSGRGTDRVVLVEQAGHRALAAAVRPRGLLVERKLSR